jgi:hypothetical protein
VVSRLAHAIAAVALVATAAHAQLPRRVEPSAADLAIALGRLADAEAELYAASRRAPREPSARGALGSFLASRGQLKVGAVLLEEARQFGGDPLTIDARLAHIYRWRGEWNEVAALSSPAADGEREMARWLAAHPGTISGPDSAVTPLEPNELAGIGRIVVGVGGTTLPVDVDPSIEGLMLPSTVGVLAALRTFATPEGGTTGVVFEMTLGGYSLTNVPVRLSPDERARIGFDVLARLTPTFDQAGRRLTLRLRPPERPRGEEVAILLTFPGVRLVVRDGQAPVALEAAAGRAALRGARWTFDLRHGALIVDR